MESLVAKKAVAQSEYDAVPGTTGNISLPPNKVRLPPRRPTKQTSSMPRPKSPKPRRISRKHNLIWTGRSFTLRSVGGSRRPWSNEETWWKTARHSLKLSRTIRSGPTSISVSGSCWSFERKSKRKEDNSIDPTNLKVQLQRSGDTGFPFEGHLDYYDPKIDQDTGTLQLRAVFENKPVNGSILLPGLFVRVRVQIGQYENALLIPERAIGRDQAGVVCLRRWRGKQGRPEKCQARDQA